MDLAAAFDYYDEHGFIMFWNPRDITEENLRTDTPSVEALLIEPGNISSCEVHEGQYLVEDSKLQDYHPYPGHTGIDKVVKALKEARCEFFATTVIEQCVRMRWQIMVAAEGDTGIFFKRYQPPSDRK
jgi:hypothetical protein